MDALLSQPPLRVQRRLAAHPRRGDRLTVGGIRDVAGGEDALDTRVRAERRRPADVPLVRQFDLSGEEIGVRRMTDRREVTGDGQFFGLVSIDRAAYNIMGTAATL